MIKFTAAQVDAASATTAVQPPVLGMADVVASVLEQAKHAPGPEAASAPAAPAPEPVQLRKKSAERQHLRAQVVPMFDDDDDDDESMFDAKPAVALAAPAPSATEPTAAVMVPMDDPVQPVELPAQILSPLNPFAAPDGPEVEESATTFITEPVEPILPAAAEEPATLAIHVPEPPAVGTPELVVSAVATPEPLVPSAPVTAHTLLLLPDRLIDEESELEISSSDSEPDDDEPAADAARAPTPAFCETGDAPPEPETHSPPAEATSPVSNTSSRPTSTRPSETEVTAGAASHEHSTSASPAPDAGELVDFDIPIGALVLAGEKPGYLRFVGKCVVLVPRRVLIGAGPSSRTACGLASSCRNQPARTTAV